MYLFMLYCTLCCFSLLGEPDTPYPQASYPAEIVETLQEQQVQFVNFLFTDIHGNIKEVTVPINHVSDAIEHGLSFDGSSVPGCSNISDSDMLLKPDMSTARIIPWFMGVNKTVIVLCDVYENVQTPHAGDPRRILKELMQEAADLGYVFNVGPELEFFILKKDETKPIDEHAYWAAETNAQHFIQKSSLVHVLTQMGIDIEKIHHEVAPGQHEVVLKYGNALHIADQLILAKFSLQSVAQEYGHHISFMPKPFANQNGSALHIHFSLWDSFHQRNAFCNGIDDKLSDIGQQFLAGVLHHINDLTALFNPTINSFKRLVPGYEAPTYICWGTKNRSALVRVPQVFHQRHVRAELRCPDPSCNPYLAFAALLKAGLDGIKNKRALPRAVEENLYKLTAHESNARTVASLPRSLEEALYNLKHSSLAKTLMGTKTLEQFLQLKQEEVHAYNTHVSAWELARFL